MTTYHEMEEKLLVSEQLEGKRFLGGAGQPGAKVEMKATHCLSKYLEVINQTNQVLNKICSTHLP